MESEVLDELTTEELFDVIEDLQDVVAGILEDNLNDLFQEEEIEEADLVAA